MAEFQMCNECQREYNDPANRRFHAQPIACPACGPHLAITDNKGNPLTNGCPTTTLPRSALWVQFSAIGGDPINIVCDVLRNGGIAAIKGLGGFHLACDATNPAAVAELRKRKHRDEKPFAIMVQNLAAAEAICEISEDEKTLLTNWRRPIVLLRKWKENSLPEEIAPQNPFLGIMLTYTPLHVLIFDKLNTRGGLVMTSGNRADEPIAYQNNDATDRLQKIADVILTHNRTIHTRCDDSVVRVSGGGAIIRRSRGYAPEPIKLPFECTKKILAVGSQLKNTFALGEGRNAILSHHLGDLDHLEAYQAFQQDIKLYENLFRFRPEIIAHDLHPNYTSTHYAKGRGMKLGSVTAVQHHHAHMASCMAENNLNEKVIAITFDGTGYGPDNTIWGGEFLVGDYTTFQRVGHLRPIPLPGGDAAIKEIWRTALAHMLDANTTCDRFLTKLNTADRQVIEKMIERNFNSPKTSSMGRLFDAVAALTGTRSKVTFEGQAAMELEWTSDRLETETYPFEIENGVIDTRPLIRAVIADVQKGIAASTVGAKFHQTVIEMIATMCQHIRRDTGLTKTVLTGGVFMNEILVTGATQRLTDEGFAVYRHRLVPTNDGGLCLGQIAVANAIIT